MAPGSGKEQKNSSLLLISLKTSRNRDKPSAHPAGFPARKFHRGHNTILHSLRDKCSPAHLISGKILHHLYVARVSGTDKLIIRDIHFLPQILETNHHFIYQLLRGDSQIPSGFFYLLSVFVGTGREKDLIPPQAIIASQNISSTSSVSMTNMRNVIYIVNRSSNVKLLSIFHLFNQIKNLPDKALLFLSLPKTLD